MSDLPKWKNTEIFQKGSHCNEWSTQRKNTEIISPFLYIYFSFGYIITTYMHMCRATGEEDVRFKVL